MIDHMGIAVSDIAASRRFYEAALHPLGLAVQKDMSAQTEGESSALGFGEPDTSWFWISDKGKVGEGIHVAFEAKQREQVDAFHAAGLKAGGRDNGKPGPRPDYGPHYYAAFLYDPDGANIEAVCYAGQ